jgi:hypothetical protein
MTVPGRADTPWRHAIDALLADGEWHDREELLAAGAAAVPPGVAFRNGERQRLARRSVGSPTTRHRGDNATAIAVGARVIADKILWSRARRGSLERTGDRYRKRPS